MTSAKMELRLYLRVSRCIACDIITIAGGFQCTAVVDTRKLPSFQVERQEMADGHETRNPTPKTTKLQQHKWKEW